MKFGFQARDKALSEPATEKELLEAEALICILDCKPNVFINALGAIRALKEGVLGE